MSGLKIQLTGAWAQAHFVTSQLPGRFEVAVKRALLQEAHDMRGKLVKNITSGGALAGAPFAALSPWTLAIRRFKGFGGTKPLIRTGSLRNSISVVQLASGGVFVGIRRQAKGAGGQSLVNLAELHEFGKTFTMHMTPKMRRFLAAAAKAAGLPFGGGGKGGGSPGLITITIPARPFMGPVFDKFAQPADVKKRFWERVAKALGYDLGTP